MLQARHPLLIKKMESPRNGKSKEGSEIVPIDISIGRSLQDPGDHRAEHGGKDGGPEDDRAPFPHGHGWIAYPRLAPTARSPSSLRYLQTSERNRISSEASPLSPPISARLQRSCGKRTGDRSFFWMSWVRAPIPRGLGSWELRSWRSFAGEGRSPSPPPIRMRSRLMPIPIRRWKMPPWNLTLTP